MTLLALPRTLLAPPRHLTPELAELVTATRSAVNAHAGWRQTARLVAEQLRRHLPTPAALAAVQQADGADGGRSRLLHAEPDGTFSILALVWHPHQDTRIHDHVTWCVFGVVQGVEHEELFTLDDRGDHLVPTGRTTNRAGEVGGFAPPGDIHRVRNPGADTAISIHIYGTDITRVGSSVRRYYDLPVHHQEVGSTTSSGPCPGGSARPGLSQIVRTAVHCRRCPPRAMADLDESG